MPLSAGGFVYIALADLVPELQHDRSLRALPAALLWLLLRRRRMLGLTKLFPLAERAMRD